MTKLEHVPRARLLAASGAALVAVGALGGCGNGLTTSSGSTDAGSGEISTSSTPTPSPTPSRSEPPATSSGIGGDGGGDTAAPAPSSSPSSAQASSPSRTPGVCANSQLSVGLQQPTGGAAAGSVYVLLTFANTGAATCTMSGHPGVSFVGKGDGTQLGTPADRYGSVRTVTLAAGDSTSAVVKIVDAGVYDADDCAPTTSDGFRVYPPDNLASVYVAFATQACQAADPGGHSQLQVSAVGGAH